MNKRSKMVLLGIILLAFVAMGTKPLWSERGKEKTEVPQVVTSQSEPGEIESSQETTKQQKSASTVNAKVPKLAQLLDDSFAKGKPVAVVYMYNADC